MSLKSIALLAMLSLRASAQHGSNTVVNPHTGPHHAQAGAETFRSRCSACHGAEGKGAGAGPALVRRAFTHGGTDEALFQTINKGVPGTSMPSFSSLSGIQVWQLVTYIRSLGVARGAPMKGDAQAGATIFKSNCSRCHAAGGEGGYGGPDLSRIASLRSVAEIREAIVDPGKEVASQYWSITATDASGKAIRGVRLNEDTFSVQIRDPQGHLRSLNKADLKDFTIVRRSPMPSFEGKLSEADIDNVIAFLRNLGEAQQ